MEIQSRSIKPKGCSNSVSPSKTRSSSCDPFPEKGKRLPFRESSANIEHIRNLSKSVNNVNTAAPSAHLKYSRKSHLDLNPDANSIPSCIDILQWGQGRWEKIEHQLILLKLKVEQGTVTPRKGFGNLVETTVNTYFLDSSSSNFRMLEDPEIVPKLRVVLPIIVDLALKLPTLFAGTFPLLASGDNATVSVSRKLCACMLANAFLCTIPEDNRTCPGKEPLPNINFLGLFHVPENLDDGRYSMKKEKLKCLLSYFAQRIGDLNDDLEKISFERRCKRDPMEWKDSNRKLCNVKILTSGMIEDAEGKLQVDFANRIIGGGVLNNGCVQEEIRFATWPELILARLFMEPLTDDEVVVMTGAKKYSEYSGYSRTFKYLGPVRATNNGKSESRVVAMDALFFYKQDPERQYEKDCIDRELHKALVGFMPSKSGDNVAVATGNWGCGAFNGDPQLKFLLQWMATSEAERDSILYHTFGNEKQTKEIKRIARLVLNTDISVGQLYETLLEYGTNIGKYKSVFRFLVKISSQKKNAGLCTCA